MNAKLKLTMELIVIVFDIVGRAGVWRFDGFILP